MKKIKFLIIVLLLFCLSFALAGCLDPNKKDYEAANDLFSNGDFKAAAESFANLGEYKDSEDREKQSLYFYAEECFDKQDFDGAIKIFSSIDGYQDSSEKKKEAENQINNILYEEAVEYVNSKRYEEAAETFKSIAGYKDADEILDECNKYIKYNQAVYFFNDGQSDSAYSKFVELGDFLDSSSYAAYIEAGNDAEAKKYGEAAEKYLSMRDFLDSAELYETYAYIYCDEQYQLGNRILSIPNEYINKWRDKRISDLKNNLSLNPVEITGTGLYVDDSIEDKYGADILIRRVIQDVPVFFLADSPQKVKYLMNFGASEKYYGTYSDGTDGYETAITITIKDIAAGQILFSKSYAAPPPFRTAQKGDIYGNYDFFETGEDGESAYSKDIFPVLETLFN